MRRAAGGGSDDLSAADARRIALAAQGFAVPRPTRRAGLRDVRRVVDRLGLLQIDSVAAVARSHYLPLQARLGDYPMPLLDEMAYERRELFEVWGHAASLVPVGLHPLLRWRHAAAADPTRTDTHARWASEHRDLIERVHRRIADDGPIAAEDLGPQERRGGSWWQWSEAKAAAEWLLRVGRVAVSARPNFVRHYDLAERVIPAEVLAAPTPARADAVRELLALSARALGVGTAADVADYFRIGATGARPRLEELVEAGRLQRVRVEGWDDVAYVDPSSPAVRRTLREVSARALLSPFDPLVFERRRTERMFAFRYRLEMYVPERKRVHGYYVMPLLLGEAIVARVDVRAVRGDGELRVPGAFLEAGRRAADVAGPLAAELRVLAGWLGLPRVRVGRRGDLTAALRAEVAAGTG